MQAKTREVLEARQEAPSPPERGPVERRNERQGREYREGKESTNQMIVYLALGKVMVVTRGAKSRVML